MGEAPGCSWIAIQPEDVVEFLSKGGCGIGEVITVVQCEVDRLWKRVSHRAAA